MACAKKLNMLMGKMVVWESGEIVGVEAVKRGRCGFLRSVADDRRGIDSRHLGQEMGDSFVTIDAGQFFGVAPDVGKSGPARLFGAARGTLLAIFLF